MFRLSKLKSGFHEEEFNSRENPYGSLARRTVGDMFAAKDQGRTARCGLELSYDSLLRGTEGIVHRRKVLNKFLSITDTPPINGCDIVTTIDVAMQDAERAVIDELKEINGNVGVAIVMEVKTGDVKAIVNMEKCIDGEYREIKDHAVSDLLEPGSVFKPVSIMTALQDGVCDTNEVVETGNGVFPMYGRDMKDWNWRRWRLRHDEPAEDAEGEFQHRRKPHHRQVLSQRPRKVCTWRLPLRHQRRPPHPYRGCGTGSHSHAEEKQAR